MHVKDKRPLNEKNQAHGYWEVYYPNGQLHFKGSFINGDVIGPYESYNLNGDVVIKCNYLNKMIYGFCEHLKNKFYCAR
jgi:antitoxin component YwqK of YwqJK toxin-antitoxin module